VKKFAIPVVFFALIGVLLAYGLRLDPRKIPSPLVDKPLPTFALPSVSDPARTVGTADLRGRVYLLNVWASWCVACREEHPLLVDLAKTKTVPIIGLNYKDKREDAIRWLQALGNPYELSLADLEGRVGIELGVYGVPETFLIDREGVIRYKHIGPVTPEVLAKVLLPKVAELGGPTPTLSNR
jgi:cytochrome c biogenesis protein CcmG/thiol:disulfide interchange protein DsbE